jgi:hypothetical protein
MPTTRIAFVCVLTACLLFSCNNKKNNSNVVAQTENTVVSIDTTQLLSDDFLAIGGYCKDFEKGMLQIFSAQSNKISVIKAAKGLSITVDPSVLEKEDGSPVDGKININIIELTSANDLFKSNAATVSNGRLLASGGSYFIGMECNGQKLRIKKDKTMQVDFPVITANEMELFYGERNKENEMNWKRAGVNLQAKADEGLFAFDRNDYMDYYPAVNYIAKNKLTLFRSLNEKVYYYNRKMTLDELVDTINRLSKKVFLDTVYTWPRSLDTLPKGTWIDTSYLLRVYGPKKQFYLKTYKSLQDEKDRIARQQAIRDSMLANWKSRSLSGQIQKYYQPSGIATLGWINCDRFYQNQEQTEVELDLPVTFNNSKIQFFIIFKSFNGLLNVNIDAAEPDKNRLTGLPVGESVILVGFSKVNGKILHCREEFTIRKNQPLQVNFKNIQPEQMKEMFGKNVRI